MKSKAILSSLLALSLAVSSYGVVMADTDSGELTSSQDNAVFSWNYNDNGILYLKKTNHTYPNPSKDWKSTLWNDITTMYISGGDTTSQPAYTYSDFSTGMYSLETINVSGNCKKLNINNYAPNIKKISLSNNAEKNVTIDMTDRKVNTFPTVSLYNVSASYVYINAGNYQGPNSVTIPACYGNSDKITYDFSHSSVGRVTFEEGTKVIPEDAFYDNASLYDVNIPDGVTAIEYNAFRDCVALKSISIPASVQYIGMNAFKNSALKTINFAGTRSQWYGLVSELASDGEVIGETLHLDKVTVHCSDGDVMIHHDAEGEANRYEYYQTYLGWEQNSDGKWSYRLSSGNLCTTFVSENGNFYFFDDEGIMKTGWIHITGSLWYYANPSGDVVKSGWKQIGGKWYYFENYLMQDGWKEIDGKWYYLEKGNGAMVTGWKQIDGVWYFLKSNGEMAQNEWCQGYWLNANGSWTYPYKATWRQSGSKWWYGDDHGWYAKNETLKIDGKLYKFDASGWWIG